MRLGVLFDEETSEWIKFLSDYMEMTPYSLLSEAVITMKDAFLGEDNDDDE